MLLVVTVLFAAMWILGMISNYTWHGKIHLLLALAITSLILHIIQHRTRTRVGYITSNPSHQRRDATLLNRRK